MCRSSQHCGIFLWLQRCRRGPLVTLPRPFVTGCSLRQQLNPLCLTYRRHPHRQGQGASGPIARHLPLPPLPRQRQTVPPPGTASASLARLPDLRSPAPQRQPCTGLAPWYESRSCSRDVCEGGCCDSFLRARTPGHSRWAHLAPAVPCPSLRQRLRRKLEELAWPSPKSCQSCNRTHRWLRATAAIGRSARGQEQP